ncbi:unnamed protein product [Meloidogyne enterolobii]|uniref:Uncharacterized protein n=1 Tax=Meloidogyne enterolobii TaxID=390850 RepID=A0ACB0Z4Z6_MELEN
MFYKFSLLIISSLIYSSNSQQCSGKPNYNCKYVCNGIDFLVEGLENSDYGLSLKTSDYQRSRPANGFIKCNPNSTKPTLVDVFYDSQAKPGIYEPEAIRVLCGKSGGMKNFCVCNEDGNCFVPVKNNVPVYAELAPYCDQYAGPHVYLELYRGALSLENNPNILYTPKPSQVFGCGTDYMKIGAVSCNGCAVIKKALCKKDCKGYFVPNKLDVQDIKGILNN